MIITPDARTGRVVRFCRSLALVSGASAVPVIVVAALASTWGGCSSTSSGAQAIEDAPSDTHAACDGACGVTIDTGTDTGTDAVYSGDAMGVAPGDAAIDTNPDVPAGGPGAAPDLPFFA